MKTIVVHQELISDAQELPKLCPFGAIIAHDNSIEITEECRLCLICVRKGPKGVFTLDAGQTVAPKIDMSQWRGILVYIEQHGDHIHPVSLEMLGKAQELGAKSNQPIYAVMIGTNLTERVHALFSYGIDTMVVYDNPAFNYFRIEPYTAALHDAITQLRPSVVLVGGTTNGRMVAPRCAARLKTGLTADCTFLDIQPNGDLDQIRPAFGGNIMAHIRTTRHRPQFATVRYKIFEAAKKLTEKEIQVVSVFKNKPTVLFQELETAKLSSNIKILQEEAKGVGTYIEDASILIAIGKGVGKASALPLFEELALALGGMVACTRPLVENGWMDPRKQIGLSGRTVKPKLIITCGVSGSVQFAAGMNSSERIIAINIDPKAPIFKTAHIGIVGDVFTIIPQLLSHLQGKGMKHAQ